MTPISSHSLKDSFVALAGQMAEAFSFNRSIGQIYGFLYMSSKPLSLEEIAQACHMSKGNASIHLRTLENWGAVAPSGRLGSRKDYYVANTHLRGLAAKRIQEGITKRIDFARQKLKSIKEDPSFADYSSDSEGTYAIKRLQEIESLLQEIEAGLSLVPKLFKLKNLFQ